MGFNNNIIIINVMSHPLSHYYMAWKSEFEMASKSFRELNNSLKTPPFSSIFFVNRSLEY